MLNILRGIRTNMINKKNIKGYVLYAIGEIILVVIGILIALQINTWNDDYKKRKEEHRILQNFNHDLELDIQQLNDNIASTYHRMKQIDSIFNILHEPDANSIPTIIRLNVGITKGDLFELNSGTFDESLASGKINYIHVDSLREKIFEYYRSINQNLTQKNSYKFLIETILPQWGDIIIPTQEALNYLGLKNSMPPLDIPALANDKKYITVLAQTYGNHATLVELWQGYIRKAIDLQKEIAAGL